MKIIIKTIPTHSSDVIKIEEWTLEEVLNEINRDRSEDWTDYDESDWIEGWNEWVEGDYYHIVGFVND